MRVSSELIEEMKRFVFVFTVFVCRSFDGIRGYNILSISSDPVESHDLPASTLLLELARRGHNVTSYTMIPRKYNLSNYQEVDIGPCFRESFQHFRIRFDKIVHMSSIREGKMWKNWNVRPDFMLEKGEKSNDCQPLINLIEKSEKYDVLLYQPFWFELFAGFAHKLQVPCVSIFPNNLYLWLYERMGSPTNPAYLPPVFELSANSDEFSDFWTRVKSFGWYLEEKMLSLYLYRIQDVVNEKLFGKSVPSASRLALETSLILANIHFSFHATRPLVPGIVEIGGIHIRNASALPSVSLATCTRSNCLFT